MNSFEKQIKSGILRATNGDLESVTPGLCLQVISHGKLKADIKMGETYRYYDLASLTKIIFTNSMFMELYDESRIELNDKVSAILDWWPYKNIQLNDLLSHSAGLSNWAPFYKKINVKKSLIEKRQQLKKMLLKTERSRSSKPKAVYSDIDYLVLGFVLEELCGVDLLHIWKNLQWREKVPSLHFNLNNKPLYKREFYAPTEKCLWRKKILQGEVHDDNTWSFGGVSSHAGLFGTIDDVTKYGQALRKSYRGEQSWLASHETVKKFTKRAIPMSRGDWALGFMLPTRGRSSCGKYFDESSFGHTGFTGTSLWYDPKRDLLVTLLSNRVHPTRKNSKFVELRPKIHDLIVEALEN
jgi:CubicO group peptidase (beta-lactamase class C family)